MKLSLPIPGPRRPPDPHTQSSATNAEAISAQEAAQRADDAMLNTLQHAAFIYFVKNSNPQNGLVADTTRDGSPSSIAATGFALSTYPVAVEHGRIDRVDAVQRR